MAVVDPRVQGQTLLTVCANGYGKRTDVSEYRMQHRNGSGTINIKTTERNGPVVALKAVTDQDDIVLITRNGVVMRMAVADSRSIGRATQGVRLINLKEGDELISVERVVNEGDDEERVRPPGDFPEDEASSPDLSAGDPAAGGPPGAPETGAVPEADGRPGQEGEDRRGEAPAPE
jgi:DNA gyrase subunit A